MLIIQVQTDALSWVFCFYHECWHKLVFAKHACDNNIFAGIEEMCSTSGEYYVHTGHGCLKPDYKAPTLSRQYSGVTLELCKNLCSKLHAIDCSMVAYMPTVRIHHNSFLFLKF